MLFEDKWTTGIDLKIAGEPNGPLQHVRDVVARMVLEGDQKAIAIIDQVLGEGWQYRPEQRARCRSIVMQVTGTQVVEVDGSALVKIIAPRVTSSHDGRRYHFNEAVVEDLRGN